MNKTIIFLIITMFACTSSVIQGCSGSSCGSGYYRCFMDGEDTGNCCPNNDPYCCG